MACRAQTTTQRCPGEVQPEKAQRESVDVLLDIPIPPQAKILRELTALYYALLGPQTILKTSSNVSRPPFPLGYKDTDDRPRFMPGFHQEELVMWFQYVTGASLIRPHPWRM